MSFWQDVKFAFKDYTGDFGYTGFGLNVDAAKDYGTTYVPAVNTYCDAKIMSVKSIITSDVDPAPVPVDGENVERVGTIRIYNRGAGVNGRRNLPLQLLGIKDTAIAKPALGSTAREAVADAVVTAVVGAFITDSGETAADWTVIRNYVSQRPV